MSAREAFRTTLWRELWKAGLIPDAAQYRETYAEVMRLGRLEHQEVRARFSTITWWRGLMAVGQPWPMAVQRILGWGRLLTEYFIAPLPLTGAQRDSVARLGALENLIVTLYDSFVDSRGAGVDALSRAALERAIDGRESFFEEESGTRRPVSSVILVQLTVGYFSCLNHLSTGSKNPHVRNTVGKSILAMYDAEQALLASGRPMSPIAQKRMLLRTSACPFVVMGLPAWLMIPEMNPELYGWHLRWLYRLGQFCVWVDHAIDWEQDVASRHPNLVVNGLSDMGWDSRAVAELAYQIAHEGALLVDEWQHRLGAGQLLASTLRTAIQTCVASWFGGVTAD